MNQQELYERQIKGTFSAGNSELGGREGALLSWVMKVTKGAAPGVRIAELSIGDGQLSRALARAYPAGHIDCMDISPSRLRQLKNSLVSTELLSRISLTHINFDTEFDRIPRESYEIVVAIDVLEHVVDVFGFVRNCKEVLKVGGWLFLRVPNVVYIKRRLEVMTGQLPVTSSWFETPGLAKAWKEKHGWDGGHLHYFTIPTLRWLLWDEGFVVAEVRDVGAAGEWIRRIWPSLLYGNIAVAAQKTSS